MYTNNEAYVSAPSLEVGINPSMLTSIAPTPLGTLSVLPLELQNKVYSHLYVRYIRLYQRSSHMWNHMDDADIPIKRVSKRVREEFLDVLYAEAVFIIDDYHLSIRERTDHRILFIDRIQNLKYLASMYLESDKASTEDLADLHQVNEALTEKTAEPISFFTGAEVSRKTCVIELRDITPKALLIIQSPFIDAIKGLTCFRTVVLELYSFARDWCPEDALAYVQGDPSNANHVVRFRAIADAMSRALEPSLGPSVIGKISSKKGVWRTGMITFQPRDYKKKKNDLKTILGDEGNESLSQVTRSEVAESYQGKITQR